MYTTNNTLKHIKNIKISKNAIIENDKKLLINKLGFNNLSHLNLPEDVDNQNNNHNKNKHSTPNLKIELNNNNKSSILIKIKKHHSNSKYFQKKNFKTNPNKITTIKNLKTNNISTNSSNEITNNCRGRKSSNSIKNLLKNNLLNNNKSYSILPIKPLINAKTMLSNSLNKKQKMFKEGKNNNNNNNNINSFKTTTTHTLKTNKSNQNMNSITELPGVCPQINLIKNVKIIKKHKGDNFNCTINASSGLLAGLKNQKIKNKEKSYKIFNDNIYINNNVYNKTNNKYKGKTNKNSPTKNYKSILDSFERKNIQSFSNIFNNKDNNLDKKRNNSIKHKKKNCSSCTQIINLANHNKKYDLKKSIISVSNENSEDTRKESGLDLHKLFNDKIYNNIDNNNVINGIIQNNMKILFNKINEQNVHIQNKQIEQNSIIYNDNKSNDKQKHLNYFNNLIRNSDEQLKNLNDSTKNENFSSVNENNDNINKVYKSSKIINHIQDIQCSQDKNSAQTCTTGDRHNKISKYVKQQIYNISQRYLSDEVTFRSKNKPNKNYKFINDIIIKNRNIPLIDIKRLLKLNDITIYRLLSFSYDNYFSIISSNKLLKNKINNSLVKIFQHVIDDFKLKYKDFLKVLNFSFIQKTINTKNYLFNLIIECQVITKEIHKSYEIGCDYVSNGKKYDNKWKFDVHKKEDIKLWLCTELDIINNSFRKFTYTSQVASFCYEDIFELQFNIFSQGNNIDPISIEWSEPVISNSKPFVYQNTSFISSISFDQLRACEVETQILFWKKKIPEEEEEIINDFKKIFEKYFIIKNISYDISKFYFYKFIIVANKKGLLKQNKFSTFDINIIDYKDNIKNEIQCVYLMNSNYYTKTMDIRIGTYVTFYLVDMKK